MSMRRWGWSSSGEGDKDRTYESGKEERPWVLPDRWGGVFEDHGRDEVAEEEAAAEGVMDRK